MARKRGPDCQPFLLLLACKYCGSIVSKSTSLGSSCVNHCKNKTINVTTKDSHRSVLKVHLSDVYIYYHIEVKSQYTLVYLLLTHIQYTGCDDHH